MSHSPTITCDIALLRSLFHVKWRSPINIASLRDWGTECINTAATPGTFCHWSCSRLRLRPV